MTAQRTFTSRARQAENPDEIPRVSITLNTELPVVDDAGAEVFEDGELVYEITYAEAYTFSRPDNGRLLLMASAFGAAGAEEDRASEIFATLRAMLSESDYKKLRARIEGPPESKVELEVLIEIITALTEEWAEGFPTQPSSDSSAAPQRTGGRSTGRSPGRGSTRSTSRSRDS